MCALIISRVLYSSSRRRSVRACMTSALLLAIAELLLQGCCQMPGACLVTAKQPQEQQAIAGEPCTHTTAAARSQSNSRSRCLQGMATLRGSQGGRMLHSRAPAFVPSPEYLAAFKKLMIDFEGVVSKCQFSLHGMADNNNTVINVKSPNVFMPAASWLRAFFHDAGTFVQSTKKGGPNGSLGVGCPNSTCATLNIAVQAAGKAICPNGSPSVGSFTDGLNYCCPKPTQCVVLTQSFNKGKPGPGLVVPGCLDGSLDTVELCRRENDGLVPAIQMFRGRQNNPAFQLNTSSGLQKISLADIIVGAAVVAVKQCSGGAVVIQHTAGRQEATVADKGLLLRPADIILDDKHFTAFTRMGLSKQHMATLVTGSHSIGGVRPFGLGLGGDGQAATCPFTPFDCTPAYQLSRERWPFDNSVFKVACDGVRGLSIGDCPWKQQCTNPAIAEPGCPFEKRVRDRFAACGGYPQPGLFSDVYLCQRTAARSLMVKYARNETLFFEQYAKMFVDLAASGFNTKDLLAFP